MLYGERGLWAIEVKRASRLRDGDLGSLQSFKAEYPMAQLLVLYTGARAYHHEGIRVLPVADALPRLLEVLTAA